MVKLILIDLDGTLLKDHYQISQGNLAAIKYAIDKGVKVGLNTGRNALSALLFSSMAGMNAPVISAAGSLVLDGGEAKLTYETMHLVRPEIQRRKCIFQSLLSNDVITRANEISKAANIRFHACTRDGYYVVGEGNKQFTMEQWKQQAQDMMLVDAVFISNYDEFLEKYGNQVTKMSFSSIDQRGIDKVWSLWEQEEAVKLTRVSGGIFEITDRNVDKGSAALELCKHMGISPQDVGAIGDDNNDIAMFKVCGTSIAMGQAASHIKEVCDFVVDSCDKDGCAQGIYKLIDG